MSRLIVPTRRQPTGRVAGYGQLVAKNSRHQTVSPGAGFAVMTVGDGGNNIFGFRKGTTGSITKTLWGDTNAELKNLASVGANPDTIVVVFNSDDGTPYSGGEKVIVSGTAVDDMDLHMESETIRLSWQSSTERYEGTQTLIRAWLQVRVGMPVRFGFSGFAP